MSLAGEERVLRWTSLNPFQARLSTRTPYLILLAGEGGVVPCTVSDWLTDTTENITFWQLRLWAVKITRFWWDLHIQLRNRYSNLHNLCNCHRSSKYLLEHHTHPGYIIHNRIRLQKNTYYHRDVSLISSNSTSKRFFVIFELTAFWSVSWRYTSIFKSPCLIGPIYPIVWLGHHKL